jgi:hypothetical protein
MLIPVADRLESECPRVLDERASFLRLIHACAGRPAVLGGSGAEFEPAWQSYVRQRYLS